MILISLCLSLGLLNLFSYLIQWFFKPLFKLSPIMSSIYFISFFCGYPTNVKMIKEAYELKYINQDELQHLLSIASFASISFIFVSLNLENPAIIYLCHLIPSLIKALFYHKHYSFQTVVQIHLLLLLSALFSSFFPAFFFHNSQHNGISPSLSVPSFLLSFPLGRNGRCCTQRRQFFLSSFSAVSPDLYKN